MDDQYVNRAQDGSRVGQQIGRIEARTVVVWSETYQLRSDSAAAMFEVGRKYLAGGAATDAFKMIGRAVDGDYRSPEVAYYWALSALAGKPFDQVGKSHVEALRAAVQMADESIPGAWREATHVLSDLLDCYARQRTPDVVFDSDAFDDVMERHDTLPEERQEEIGRHLAMLLGGAGRDRLDAERRKQIRRHRMDGNRVRRVPLFFDADPAVPRRRQPHSRLVAPSRWFRLALGLLLLIVAVGSALVGVAYTGALHVLVLAALWAPGLFGFIVFGPEFLYLTWVNRRTEAIHRAASRRDPLLQPIDGLADLVDRRITAAGPNEPDELAAFDAAVAREQALLAAALDQLYGPDSRPPVTANELDWLVRWHARRLADRWRSGHLHRLPAPRQMPSGRIAALAGAATTTIAGGIWAVIVMLRWEFAPGLAVALGAGALAYLGALAVRAGHPVLSDRRRFREEQVGCEELRVEEKVAYEAERRRLENRPSDIEMATWMDFDKDHVRLEAMRRWGLADSDVVGHVVVTDAAKICRRARVRGGPTRYSRYVVHLFLLTTNGVRQLDVTVDFDTGAENNQQRHAFRYDAIARVRIEEPTVRRHGRRQTASPEGGGPNDRTPRPTLRQSLSLTLMDGTQIEFEAAYQDQMAEEDRDNQEALFDLERQTSGAVSALRTLESVAGEGREWLRRESERQRHTADNIRRG